MWALKNHTRYAAERAWVRDRDGAYQLVVAVRASFVIGSEGDLALANEQPAPRAAPEFEADPASSSLKHEAELGPLTPTSDVVLRANAHAKQPSEHVAVSLRVGALHKQLIVHGERTYGADGATLSRAAPFVTRPIRYEHAYGGSDPLDQTPGRRATERHNPVGRGFALDPRSRAGTLAPAIEYADGMDAASRGPAGFGPIASHWSPRCELAGSYDEVWQRERRPLLPLDYDPRFAMAAPFDQQLPSYLAGGEAVALEGMTPDGALRFLLPTVRLTFESRFGSVRAPHDGHLVSITIEPEERRLGLLFKSTLRVAARRVEQLDQTLVEERITT